MFLLTDFSFCFKILYGVLLTCTDCKTISWLFIFTSNDRGLTSLWIVGVVTFTRNCVDFLALFPSMTTGLSKSPSKGRNRNNYYYPSKALVTQHIQTRTWNTTVHVVTGESPGYRPKSPSILDGSLNLLDLKECAYFNWFLPCSGDHLGIVTESEELYF